MDNWGRPGQTGVNRLALPVVLKCLIEPGRTGTSVKNRDKPGRHRGKPYLHLGDTGVNRGVYFTPVRPGVKPVSLRFMPVELRFDTVSPRFAPVSGGATTVWPGRVPVQYGVCRFTPVPLRFR